MSTGKHERDLIDDITLRHGKEKCDTYVVLRSLSITLRKLELDFGIFDLSAKQRRLLYGY
jgi:hypothetical protein